MPGHDPEAVALVCSGFLSSSGVLFMAGGLVGLFDDVAALAKLAAAAPSTMLAPPQAGPA